MVHYDIIYQMSGLNGSTNGGGIGGGMNGIGGGGNALRLSQLNEIF